jgi:ABC-type glycerol-3-phosphate transport system substrate-binding protein
MDRIWQRFQGHRHTGSRLAGVALLGLLAACGSPATAPPATSGPASLPATPTTPASAGPGLRVLMVPDGAGLVPAAGRAFTERTGMNVSITTASWAEVYSKSRAALTGSDYDIVFIPSANAAEYGSSGRFAPLDDLLPPADRAAWLAPAVEAYTSGGSLYALPWYSGGTHMAYNATMLTRAGVDVATIHTWDDLLAACRVLKAKKVADFCFTPSAKYPANFYFNWGPMVLDFGGDFFAADGTPLFDQHDAAIRAWRLLRQGTEEGLFNSAGEKLDDYETLLQFRAGQTAFLLDSTWAVTNANVNSDVSKVAGQVLLMPIPSQPGIQATGLLFAGGFGVLKSAPHPAEARQFVQQLVSYEIQQQAALQFSPPTLLAVFDDAAVQAKWTNLAVIADQLRHHSRLAPPVPWLEDFRKTADELTGDVIAGRQTPEAAQTALLARVNALRTGSK